MKPNTALPCLSIPLPEGIILDLDGTLIREHEVLEGARRLLARFDGRHVIASNNSSDTAATLALRLARMGLQVAPDRLVLAGEEALRLIAQSHPGAQILLLAAGPLHERARSLGLRPDRRHGDVVLLCRDPGFDYDMLSNAADHLRRGVPFFVANPDLTHPGANSRLVPETGTLLAAVSACAGGVKPSQIIGKPHPHLFRRALALLGLPPHRTAMIGDNPDTDARGARAQGVPTLLIGDHAKAVARDPAGLLAVLGLGLG